MIRKRIDVVASLISLAAPALFLCVLGASFGEPGRPQAAKDQGTPATGGILRRFPQAGPLSRVTTFSKDVAPIFFKKCAACHRPDAAAPMSLLSYKDARPWATSIKEKVLDRTMPPWHADPKYGEFENDRSLSNKDIDTIRKWVDSGAPEGDPKELPPRPVFSEGWKIGKPDIVLTMPVKYMVPATGVLDYKYFEVPTHFDKDRWVQAAEVRVGNPAVVHHVIIFVKPPGSSSSGSPDIGLSDGLESLTGVAPGEDPVILPEGVGMLIRAGSALVFQVHYTPNGVAQSDQTSVGLVFCKKPVAKEAMGDAAMNVNFAIPPGDPNYEVRSSWQVDADCHLTALMPHMHVRGKDFRYTLVYPDGSSRVILYVPRYDFNWQTRYKFAQPVAAPKGSRIDCLAHFDNSPGNKSNPDPARLVRWGPQTWDEMMIGFIEFTLDHQELDRSDAIENSQKSSSRGSGQATRDNTGGANLSGLPATDVILDKYVQALGGARAIQAPVSRIMKGTISAPSIGAEGTIEIYAKAPDKLLTEVRSGALGTTRTGFDGTTAWEEKDSIVKELEIFPAREADFYLALNLRQLYPRIELKGRQKIRGREVYILEAPRGGSPKSWYFDCETGLLVRTEARDSAGRIRRAEDYDDYRDIDGVQIPLTLRRTDENQSELIIKFSEVKHNAPIDDAKFKKPPTRGASLIRLPGAGPGRGLNDELGARIKNQIVVALHIDAANARCSSQQNADQRALASSGNPADDGSRGRTNSASFL
jgi:hypothetical protein